MRQKSEILSIQSESEIIPEKSSYLLMGEVQERITITLIQSEWLHLLKTHSHLFKKKPSGSRQVNCLPEENISDFESALKAWKSDKKMRRDINNSEDAVEKRKEGYANLGKYPPKFSIPRRGSYDRVRR